MTEEKRKAGKERDNVVDDGRRGKAMYGWRDRGNSDLSVFEL